MSTPAAEYERAFDLFGSRVRLLIGLPANADARPEAIMALELEALLRRVQGRLTRFEEASELSALNRDPAPQRRVSPLLALAVRAGVRAAELSDGLVDFTLLGELERAGYTGSRAGLPGASLADALSWAPPRRPAEPHPGAAWRAVAVDTSTGVVRRPPGMRIDTGGTGKGLAADVCAGRLGGYETWAVDAGGDLRIGGAYPAPREVEVEHPLRGRPGGGHGSRSAREPALVFTLSRGAVATSGISTRLWETEDGFAHHLLDPSTGEPAWTGVIQATALAATALEAETLAKAALLAGPERGAELLEAQGGALVLDDGEVVLAGVLSDETQAPVALELAAS